MFHTITSIKLANRARGHHFFDADTMRFFRSRIGQTVHGGRYFVTSEQFDARSPRLYTIRRAAADGSISDVGGFQGYTSSASAVRAIQKLIRSEQAGTAQQ